MMTADSFHRPMPMTMPRPTNSHCPRKTFFALDDATGRYRRIELIRCSDPDYAWIAFESKKSGRELRKALCWYDWHKMRASGEILEASSYRKQTYTRVQARKVA